MTACAFGDNRLTPATIVAFGCAPCDAGNALELRHEAGHIFDFEHNSPRLRRGFMRIMGLHGRWDGYYTTSPPKEKFANGYALCDSFQTVPQSFEYDSTWDMLSYGYYPTVAQFAAVCALIRSA